MKTAQNLAAELLAAVDSAEGSYIEISKNDAVRIAELLVKAQFVRKTAPRRNGEILFYCPACEKSFSAAGREDRESFEKWNYHTWYAVYPECGREVSQSDGYWR